MILGQEGFSYLPTTSLRSMLIMKDNGSMGSLEDMLEYSMTQEPISRDILSMVRLSARKGFGSILMVRITLEE